MYAKAEVGKASSWSTGVKPACHELVKSWKDLVVNGGTLKNPGRCGRVRVDALLLRQSAGLLAAALSFLPGWVRWLLAPQQARTLHVQGAGALSVFKEVIFDALTENAQPHAQCSQRCSVGGASTARVRGSMP